VTLQDFEPKQLLSDIQPNDLIHFVHPQAAPLDDEVEGEGDGSDPANDDESSEDVGSKDIDDLCSRLLTDEFVDV